MPDIIRGRRISSVRLLASPLNMRDLAPPGRSEPKGIVEWVMPDGADHIMLADFGAERLVRLESYQGYQIAQAGKDWFRLETSDRFESSCDLELVWRCVGKGLILKQDKVLFRFSPDQDSRRVLYCCNGQPILRNSTAWQESLKARRVKHLTEALSALEPWPEVGLAAAMMLMSVSLGTEFAF